MRGGSVERGVAKSELEGLEREKVELEERRVKIAEARVCGVCGKRLGNSVIAIHNPRWVRMLSYPRLD